MKLIHCADLHLDSKMNTNLEGLQLKERKGELLNSFVRMVDYADKNRVSAILIAGDLFDKKNIWADRFETAHDVSGHALKEYGTYKEGIENFISKIPVFGDEKVDEYVRWYTQAAYAHKEGP